MGQRGGPARGFPLFSPSHWHLRAARCRSASSLIRYEKARLILPMLVLAYVPRTAVITAAIRGVCRPSPGRGADHQNHPESLRSRHRRAFDNSAAFHEFHLSRGVSCKPLWLAECNRSATTRMSRPGCWPHTNRACPRKDEEGNWSHRRRRFGDAREDGQCGNQRDNEKHQRSVGCRRIVAPDPATQVARPVTSTRVCRG